MADFYFLPSTGGRKILIMEDEIYHFREKCGNKSFWRCRSYKKNLTSCPARVTFEGNVIKSRVGQHNHRSAKGLIVNKKFVVTLKKRACTEMTTSIPRIYKSEVSKQATSKERAAHLISYKCIEGRLYKARRLQQSCNQLAMLQTAEENICPVQNSNQGNERSQFIDREEENQRLSDERTELKTSIFEQNNEESNLSPVEINVTPSEIQCSESTEMDTQNGASSSLLSSSGVIVKQEIIETEMEPNLFEDSSIHSSISEVSSEGQFSGQRSSISLTTLSESSNANTLPGGQSNDVHTLPSSYVLRPGEIGSVSMNFGESDATANFDESNVATNFSESGVSTNFCESDVTTFFGESGVATNFDESDIAMSYGGRDVATNFGESNVATNFSKSSVSTNISESDAATNFGESDTNFGNSDVSTNSCEASILNVKDKTSSIKDESFQPRVSPLILDITSPNDSPSSLAIQTAEAGTKSSSSSQVSSCTSPGHSFTPLNVPPNLGSTIPSGDRFDAFGESIALRLRNMDSKSSAIIQTIVSDFMSEVESKGISNLSINASRISYIQNNTHSLSETEKVLPRALYKSNPNSIAISPQSSMPPVEAITVSQNSLRNKPDQSRVTLPIGNPQLPNASVTFLKSMPTCNSNDSRITTAVSPALNHARSWNYSSNQSRASLHMRPPDELDLFADFVALKLRNLDPRSCVFIQTSFVDLMLKTVQECSTKDKNSSLTNQMSAPTGSSKNEISQPKAPSYAANVTPLPMRNPQLPNLNVAFSKSTPTCNPNASITSAASPVFNYESSWINAPIQSNPNASRTSAASPILNHASSWNNAPIQSNPNASRTSAASPILKHASSWNNAPIQSNPNASRTSAASPVLNHTSSWINAPIQPRFSLYMLRRDEFDAFGEFVASKLRNLDRRSSVSIRTSLIDLIVKVEQKCLSKTKNISLNGMTDVPRNMSHSSSSELASLSNLVSKLPRCVRHPSMNSVPDFNDSEVPLEVIPNLRTINK